MVIKVVTTLLGLVLAVVLARSLGPGGYGTYSYVLAVVSLLAVPIQLGLPNLVVRETARAQADKEWGLMRGLWRWTTGVAGAASLILSAAALGVFWLFAPHVSSAERETFFWGLTLVPLVALGNLRGAALRGLRSVILGQLPENVLRPALLLVLVGIFLAIRSGQNLTAPQAMGLNSGATLLAFVMGAWLLWRGRPQALAMAPAPVYDVRAWILSAIPLALISSMQLINTYADILMLGAFRTAEEVGVYRTAIQVASLVVFGQQALNMVVSPYFAGLYAQHEMKRLQRIVTVSARINLMIALPISFFLVFWGDFLLKVLFSRGYEKGYVPLGILALGQLVNAGMGSVAALLNMTGHERDTARRAAIAAISNVALNAVLIPPFGIGGAATATATTFVMLNYFLFHDVKRRLGIEPIAITIKGLGFRR